MAAKHTGEQPTGKGFRSRTLFLMTVCGILAFAVLAWKLADVMLVHHEEYSDKAEAQQTWQSTVSAKRGSITDRNGNLLAFSGTAYNVFLSPKELLENGTDLNRLFSWLSELLDVDESELWRRMENKDSQYEVIATGVEEATAFQLRSRRNDDGIVGLYLEERPKRYYPYGTLAANVLGFTASDNGKVYGLYGLEAQYDTYLSGTDGMSSGFRNAVGEEVMYSDAGSYLDVVDGADVKTTLNLQLQHIAEKWLDRAIEDYDVLNGGVCLVENVNTGEILACACRDTFDPNEPRVLLDPEALGAPEELSDEKYTERLYASWRNRAVSDTYEPGSVFKSLVLAMTLEENTAGEDSEFSCEGSLTVSGREPDDPLHCWNRYGHGGEDLRQAVQNSCNVAFATLGLRLGGDTFYTYAEAFGMMSRTRIDLPAEESGIWWSRDVFCDSTNHSQLASASIGQTFTTTPVEMLNAFCSVLNGGTLLEPYLVSEVKNADGKTIYSHGRSEVRRVISSGTSEQCRSILESVVSEGTGGSAAVAGYRVGGKTGTSEKVNLEVREGRREYMVSFCGFAPADDPEIAILLVLDTPSEETGIYISGGNMAAPTVSSMLAEMLPALGYQAEYTPEEAAAVDKRVPSLEGMTASEAEEALTRAGLQWTAYGDGDTVTDQIPEAKRVVSAGSVVRVYYGTAAADETVIVPDLYGMTVSEAEAALRELGIYAETSGTSPVKSSSVVNRQKPEAGTSVPTGTVLEIVLADRANLGRY